MPEFLKPQSPIRDKNGNYNYPLTTADQVILEDNSRLNAALEDIKDKVDNIDLSNLDFILEDNSRLNAALEDIKDKVDNIDLSNIDGLENVVYAGDNGENTTATINADTLGGVLAEQYATKNFVSTKIAEAQFGGSDYDDIDLSGFATKDDLNNFATKDDVNGTLENIKPKAGFIYPLATSVVPDGFLLCDGAEYARTEYPELFAAIGTIYGNGDGSTTFNVPNLQTRVPVGAGNGYELGDIGGEATHTLTVDEMPSHSHSTETNYIPITTSGSSNWAFVTNDSANKITKSGNQWGWPSASGGSQPHNNMQPYTVVNYIIATGKDTGVSVSDIIMGAQALPLGVEYGGTGVTTLKDARHNLGVNARNLLDNSDFRNPVNQRGNTSYIGSGSKYTIDRWKTWGNVEIMDGYIRYTMQGNTDAQYLYQHFEVGTIIAGKTYTGACKLSDGTICVGSGIAKSDGTSTILCKADADTNTVGIRIWANHADGVDKFALCLEYGVTSADIVWAALYEGEYTAETLPKYQPKGYTMELAECQRYFRIVQNGNGYVSKANAYIFFPYAFRITPTAIVTSEIDIRANGEAANIGLLGDTATLVVTMYADSIRLTFPATFAENNHAATLFNTNIWLSADL